MSSSPLCRPKSRKAQGPFGLVLEQPAPNLRQNSDRFPKHKNQRNMSFQSLDKDHRAEDRTSFEPMQALATAALSNCPIGPVCKLNDTPIGPVNSKKDQYLFRHTQNSTNNGSRVNPPELPAVVQHMNRAPRIPFKSKSQLPRSKGTAGVPRTPKNKLLGYESKAGSGTETHLAATACEDFQKRMKHIPAEICQIIMDMIFDEAFGPRRVHPHKDPSIMNIFLALDRKLYDKFHEQYWTKNTWVISKGPLNKTMRFMTEKPYNETTTEFSLQVPNKAALQIRSAELSFSNADTPDLSEWVQLAQQSPAPFTTPTPFSPFTTQVSHEVQPLQTAQRDTARLNYAQRYDEIQRQLIHTWQDKFDRIAMLNLRHLTLDFTEAYDPGGLYLGVHLVRRLIPFAHGIPGDFKISAPDRWLEGQIREAFLGLNQS